jgi:hypothetical protein
MTATLAPALMAVMTVADTDAYAAGPGFDPNL